MKILFVCKGNVGRSQMAKAFFNHLSDGDSFAESCGTNVFAFEGQKICNIENDGVEIDIQCMQELGFDISQYKRQHITEKLCANADKIIVMAEKSTWPNFLKNSNKVEFWNINNPKGQSLKDIRSIRDTIKTAVELLLAS